MIFRILSLMLNMHVSNMNVKSGHPYSSKWWSWPLCLSRWVLYWTVDGRHIICMGNVLLWYPVFIGILIRIIKIIITKDLESHSFSTLIGYLLSYLPFAIISRDMFLYHYAIPLLFGIYNICNLVDETSPKARGFLFCLLSSMCLFGYFLWNPWVYGLTTPDFNFLVWNNKWRG